mmetsp:Transcript_64/g.216  ORF Transcript_64/g.216 Transcript_64/m.216 type:complete len:264 (-) Transcript_64:19-810(-)|eukprot:scaffold20728_cov132-Isochrysis_galbana.AAC.9
MPLVNHDEIPGRLALHEHRWRRQRLLFGLRMRLWIVHQRGDGHDGRGSRRSSHAGRWDPRSCNGGRRGLGFESGAELCHLRRGGGVKVQLRLRHSQQLRVQLLGRLPLVLVQCRDDNLRQCLPVAAELREGRLYPCRLLAHRAAKLAIHLVHLLAGEHVDPLTRVLDQMLQSVRKRKERRRHNRENVCEPAAATRSRSVGLRPATICGRAGELLLLPARRSAWGRQRAGLLSRLLRLLIGAGIVNRLLQRADPPAGGHRAIAG